MLLPVVKRNRSPVPAIPASGHPQANLPAPAAPLRLTVQDAEATALKNNPRISVYRLLALASAQVTREQKAAYYPNLYGSLTGVTANEGGRIAAGNFNNPIVFQRAAGGLTLSQLITDFGRTNNLVAAAALHAKAADMNSIATAEQIRLTVDQAFYNALQSFAEQKVAEQTVAARQAGIGSGENVVSEQIALGVGRQLRGCQPRTSKALATGRAEYLPGCAVTAFAGSGISIATTHSSLVETDTTLTAPSDSVNQLVGPGIRESSRNRRPKLTNFVQPSISRKRSGICCCPACRRWELWAKPRLPRNSMARILSLRLVRRAGVNVNIPIFNGFLYPARSKEAALRAQASQEQLRDLKDRIANDVRTSWLNAITAFNRISVSQQFVNQANLALDFHRRATNSG